MFGIKEVGIDLGTSSVLIYLKGKGVVLREPSVVAVDTRKGTAIATGYKAQRMLGRTPEHIKAVRPLRDGVISDYDLTSKMLREFLRKAIKPGILGYKAIACVPSGVMLLHRRERAVSGSLKNRLRQHWAPDWIFPDQMDLWLWILAAERRILRYCL